MENLRFDTERIARPHWIRPAQFVDTQSDRALGEIQCLHKKPHGHCRSMPAACNQAFENRSLRAFASEMEHLRVKLVRELDHLFLRHFKRLGFKAAACFQIIKIVLFHSEDSAIDSIMMNHRKRIDSTFRVADTPTQSTTR